MKRSIFTFYLTLCLFPTWSMQNDSTICKTKFLPKRITYNAGSGDRCVEAVAFGIEIQSKKVKGFFSLPSGKLAELESKVANREVTVQFQFFEEREDKTGAVGWIEKVWYKSELIYEEEN